LPADTTQQPRQRRAATRASTRAATAAGLSAAALLVAGCGAGSPGPRIASSSAALRLTGQYNDCLRSHGLPTLPAPTASANGNITIPTGGANPRQLAAAELDCQRLLPARGDQAAATAPATAPPATARPATAPPGTSTADCDSVSSCYTPHELQVAYGIRPLLDRGIDGRGETVVLPELAQAQARPPAVSDLRQDMSRFDTRFDLPAARLRVVTSLAGSGSGSPWLANEEEVLDAENVHTVAPAATITVVLVKSTALDNPASAVAAAIASLQLALSEGGIVSISAVGQTGGEHCDSATQVERLNAGLAVAVTRHVTVIAASGDVGAVGEPCAVIKGLTGGTFSPVKEVNLPASDPFVLATGGTTLAASHQTGAYIGETAWGLPYGSPGTQFQASGGGFSRVFTRPAFQDDVHGTGAGRGVPDVAADASPHTGMALVISDGGDRSTIRDSGGTSASAPLWAGLVALADQYAGRQLGFINPAIYRIGRSAAGRDAFHDITTGNNTPTFPGETLNGYTAAPGWDPVTGWGSPDAEVLIPLLARDSTH
jgi:subtilase family serine protease